MYFIFSDESESNKVRAEILTRDHIAGKHQITINESTHIELQNYPQRYEVITTRMMISYHCVSKRTRYKTISKPMSLENLSLVSAYEETEEETYTTTKILCLRLQ